MPRKTHRKITLRLYPDFEHDRRVIDWLDGQSGALRRGGLNAKIITLLSDALTTEDPAPESSVHSQTTSAQLAPKPDVEVVSDAAIPKEPPTEDRTDMPSASAIMKGLFK